MHNAARWTNFLILLLSFFETGRRWGRNVVDVGVEFANVVR